MKRLVTQVLNQCDDKQLRYLLFEETSDEFPEKNFFSYIIELRDRDHSEFASAESVTCDFERATILLQKLCSGTVTPVGLPYIIEDYISEV